ncbi:hypothetical protein ACHWQZ_G002811 [Mnemiopsis leidyi]
MTTIKTQKQFQNKYRITQLLGEGGYGSVYLCIEISTRVLRAVKILSNVKDSSTSLCPRRYQAVPNEVLILESLSHPNIVRLIDVYRDETTNSWYLVQEYHPGFQDLFSFINNTGPMTTRDSSCVVKQLVNVLNYLLHEQKIDHRDIKDENILYNPKTKQIKLIDFGSAGRLSTAPYTSFRGTDVYIPPEYYQHRKYSALPATVWAVGCLSFVLLNGDCPFHSRDEVKNFQKLSDLKGSKSLMLRSKRVDFITQCMSVNSEKRALFSDLLCHPWLKI